MAKRRGTGKLAPKKPKLQTVDDGKTKASKSAAEKPTRKDGLRETIESVVVAFILAFLFRTFEAEAFVIPTGSMAPTLYGRHKEIVCEKCGYKYAIGASDEVDKEGLLISRIGAAYCPNCRYRMLVKDVPVHKGDRILVNKFPFEFGEPKRWDVVVFKYPEDPKTNYIKRLVGLPGETVYVEQGNLYKERQNGQRSILRKQDPNKQRLLQLLVYDNDHPETDLHRVGWPERWMALKRGDAGGGPDTVAGWSEDEFGWVADTKGRSFRLGRDQTRDGRFRWVRYRHIVPTDADWENAAEDPPLAPAIPPRPQLISDFCGYNAYEGGVPPDLGCFWVGDLTLSCQVEVQEAGDKGEMLLELNEGARRYRCRLDVSTGMVTLSHTIGLNRDEEEEKQLATAQTGLKGPGTYQISFANVDDRLCLWVNNGLVDFGRDSEYQPHGGLRTQAPTDDDLIPVGIAARDLDLRVSHLLIERDVYYRAEFVHPQDQFHDGRARTIREYEGDEDVLRERLDNPHEWYQEYTSRLSIDLEEYEDVSFGLELAADEFLMMGDNSPRSKDSRLWPNVRRAARRHAVPRSALVGKAFFVYWPHGVPFLNGGKGFPIFYHKERQFHPDDRFETTTTDYPSFRVPFYPHFSRMHRIR